MATPFSTEQPKQPGISRNVLLAAAAVVIVLVLVLAATTLHRAPKDAGQPDSYAPNLTTGNLQLSEATNGTGGKVTYIDGTVSNKGGKTVTAATVQLTFPTSDGTAAAPVVVPLTFIRTREPYVDLEPVSAEPLRPGQGHDFRIILEDVPAEWNQQPPKSLFCVPLPSRRRPAKPREIFIGRSVESAPGAAGRPTAADGIRRKPL